MHWARLVLQFSWLLGRQMRLRSGLSSELENARLFLRGPRNGIRVPMRALTHLDRLEAESIHILRETVAEAERPLMLCSIGRDSAVMRPLAKKAFFPGPLPFPLLHVDTGWKFRDMYALRDKVAAQPGMRLIVHRNPEAEARGINPFDHGPLHTDLWKTEGLK